MLTIPAFGSFQGGEDTYLPHDYETALKFWQPLARQGNPEAQNMLGYMYRYGQGVPQDFEQARPWYRLAAGQGFARGQNNLGMLYRQGLGVKQDYQIAWQWFLRAAEQGIDPAIQALTMLRQEMTSRQIEEAKTLAKEWVLKGKEVTL